jgi:hypothetical protein
MGMENHNGNDNNNNINNNDNSINDNNNSINNNDNNINDDNSNNNNDNNNNSDTINTLLDLNIKIPNDKYKKINAVHNSIAGHHGVERTIQKLVVSNQRWPRMRDDIKRFIKKCPCCQKMSVLKVPIHAHPFTTAA